MKPHSLNTTTHYPNTLASSESNCTALLILFQILFPLENVNKLLEQELEPMITWRQNNFTMDGPPNPTESKTKNEENKDTKKEINKREIQQFRIPLEEMLHKIHRRAAGKNETYFPVLYTELEKRYEAIRKLTKELEECKTNNNAGQGSDNLRPELREKEKEIRDLYEEISQLNISSQVLIFGLSNENRIKEEENEKLKDEVKKLKGYSAEFEQKLLQLNAENSKKDQEIFHLKRLVEQLQEAQKSAYILNVENTRKGKELLHLKAQMEELQRAKEACDNETGIGRIMRKKHQFLNKLLSG